MEGDDGKNTSEYDWRFNNFGNSDGEEFWDSDEDDGLWEAGKTDGGVTVGDSDLGTSATQDDAFKQLRPKPQGDTTADAIWDGRVQVQVGNLEAEEIEGSSFRSSKRIRRATTEDKVHHSVRCKTRQGD